MKTIAITTPYWKNSPGGGALAYLRGLVNELEKRDIKVKAVFEWGDDPSNYHIKGNRFLFPIKALWPLRKIRPEVVHSQGTWYCLLSGYLYKKVYGARLIHTFHSAPGGKKLPAYGKILVQFLLNQCDCVTYVSKALKDEIQEVWGLKVRNAVVTYAGITPRKVTENEIREFRDKFGLKDNSIVLLAQAFTANKLKAEGAKLLMKAVGNLKDRYPDIVLVLTREAEYSNELKQFAKESGLNDSVIFTGDIDNPYIPLAVCNIYTHTSLSEGLPMALLEAMSVGKPIIATSVGGIPEAISNMENGILVKPDADEIAKVIERLLADKDLAAMLGGKCQKNSRKEVHLEAICGQIPGNIRGSLITCKTRKGCSSFLITFLL